MLLVEDRSGPHNPDPEVPDRARNSVRRTSHIDSIRPDPRDFATNVHARARDLFTSDTDAVVLGTVELTAELRADSTLAAIDSDPKEPALSELIDAVVGPGFRSRMTATLPAPAEAQSLLYLLLDDLPAARLVSGYAGQRAGTIPVLTREPGAAEAIASFNADICAGWATGATILRAVAEHGEVPTPIGPRAPSRLRADDPLAWHELPVLPPGGMRRARRFDFAPDGRFDAHFRDSYCEPDGSESAVHEYRVTGRLDTESGTIAEITAEARVLPWVECPGAVASAARLVGTPVADLRTRVRADFVGTSTCTHLNDTLRALADLHTLAPVVARLRS
jgi:hypothetical protein